MAYSSIEQRLRQNSEIDPDTNCWNWLNASRGKGYGAICIQKKTCLAHRISYSVFKGPKNGLHVCHSCDNPSCINPAHLFLGTNKDNMRDMVLKGRQNKARGERQHSAKLTEADITNIRAIYKYCKISITDLAKLYKVHFKTMWNILNNNTWKHVRNQ